MFCELMTLLIIGGMVLAVEFAFILWMRDLANQEDLFRLQTLGRCVQCGYDLSGTVSDRCSECGWPVQRRFDQPAGPARSFQWSFRDLGAILGLLAMLIAIYWFGVITYSIIDDDIFESALSRGSFLAMGALLVITAAAGSYWSLRYLHARYKLLRR